MRFVSGNGDSVRLFISHFSLPSRFALFLGLIAKSDKAVYLKEANHRVNQNIYDKWITQEFIK